MAQSCTFPAPVSRFSFQLMGYPAFSLQLPVSSFQFPVSSFQLPVSSLQLLVSSFQFPASNFQLPVSSLQFPASSFQLPVSGFNSALVLHYSFPCRSGNVAANSNITWALLLKVHVTGVFAWALFTCTVPSQFEVS